MFYLIFRAVFLQRKSRELLDNEELHVRNLLLFYLLFILLLLLSFFSTFSVCDIKHHVFNFLEITAITH